MTIGRQAEALRRDIEASEERSVLEGHNLDPSIDPQAFDATTTDKHGEEFDRPKKSSLSRISLPYWARFGVKSDQSIEGNPQV